MDEVSVPQRWAWIGKALSFVFAAVVVLASLYIVWRGFAAESGRRPVPLFGEKTELRWEGRECEFVLVRYADLETVQPGELVIREGEPAPTVWRVAGREAGRLRLEHRERGAVRTDEVALPLPQGAFRYILLDRKG